MSDPINDLDARIAFMRANMENMMKVTSIYVEDSARRLMVKSESFSEDMILEEISNVNKK